jgi:hypothetical protein
VHRGVFTPLDPDREVESRKSGKVLVTVGESYQSVDVIEGRTTALYLTRQFIDIREDRITGFLHDGGAPHELLH